MDIAATVIHAWATHLKVEPGSVDAVALRSQLDEGTIPAVFARTAAIHLQATVSVGTETPTQRQLQHHVARAASALTGEEVAARLVPDGAGSAPESQAVFKHRRALLATYKSPKYVSVLSQLPRNTMSKIVRTSLRVPA